ncbi:putative LRR receptor-like serine/threonine-protein kinase [Gossypium australe]|uniref:Putative LRR receptor-like serine/threonine-protein kinase n=1 Tax=Gossypium australe TaxID=47621 RepID=A0A5B6VCP7_9ROSI|nr:putative LRR receptor-like serine/threonine-protein kinase [Gossypium australe]
MSSSGFSPAPPPVFNGEGYHIWAVKMKTYLQAFDFQSHTAQIRQHSDDRAKRFKAMSCIQRSVSDVIFTRIMACESPKKAWDMLKEEFQGTERSRQKQL